MRILILSIFLTSNLALASSSSIHKKSFSDLIEKVTQLTGKKYIFPAKVKIEYETTENLKLDKENVEQLFSYILAYNGYSQIKESGNLYKIVSSRDIRYNATPVFMANRTKKATIPTDHNYYTLIYTLSYPNPSYSITSSLRPFLTRYARIVDLRNSKKLIIHDTGANLNRLVTMIKAIDTKPTKQQLRKWAEQEEFERKLQLERARNRR